MRLSRVAFKVRNVSNAEWHWVWVKRGTNGAVKKKERRKVVV